MSAGRPLPRCSRRVAIGSSGTGVDLDGYNTVETAADVVALREALGYEKWIVWGFSYGGRVAQEVLRQDADGVAALILDSPLTAEAHGPAVKITNDKVSTATLSAACAAQPSCSSVTPDLSASIDASIAQANAHPYTAHPTASDGTKVSVLLTGQEVLQAKVFVTADATSRRPAPERGGVDRGGRHCDARPHRRASCRSSRRADRVERRDGVRRRPSGIDRRGPRLRSTTRATSARLFVLADWVYCDTWKVDSVPGGALPPRRATCRR